MDNIEILNESLEAVINEDPYDFSKLIGEELQNRFDSSILDLKENYSLDGSNILDEIKKKVK